MKRFLTAIILAAGATVAATGASATTWWVEHGVTLNARSGPGTHYDVIGKFHACSPVDVVDHQSGWSRLLWQGHYYWVSSGYLQQYECSNQSYTPRKKKSSTGY